VVQLQGDDKARYVARMFGRIAPRYDLLNTVMSLGMHQGWRRRLVRLAAEGLEGDALDVATGTGDLALALLKQPGVRRVVALDFSLEMLRLAGQKARRRGLAERLELIEGDALRLPFPDGRFACATVGWGVRNTADTAGALREMARVVRRGGRIALLDVTPQGVTAPARPLFRWYFHRVVPLLGAWLAGDREAYSYLPQSVDVFPSAEELRKLMVDCGMSEVAYRYCGLGTHALHIGRVP